ncbi:hypothetical protein B0H17DRAFT_1027829, partial [Mycena rosella]
MTHCRELLLRARPHKVPIKVGGEILLRPLLVHGQIGQPIYLTNVLYVPLLSHNLISTTYLSRVHRYSILMNETTILFKQNGVLLFEADIDERNQAFVREKILSKNLVTGAKITSSQKPDPICEPCLAGKLNA